MPSRVTLQAAPVPLLPVAAAQPHHRQIPGRIVAPIAATAAAFSLFLLLIGLFRRISRKRTAPADSKPPHRFSYAALRRATSSFSPSARLGQGGFGSVFRGSLGPAQQPVAVKLMDHGSLQGEREFQNELFFAARLDSPFVVSVVGFSSDRRRRRMLLVYDLMPNGNLQDALLHRKCPELMAWSQRFSVALDIARGIDYLHAQDPPVIHGDIKPSNILLDDCFSARLADFGLARLKSENQCEITVVETDRPRANGGSEAKKVDLESNGGVGADDCGSVVETESVMTGFDDGNARADLSPESYSRVPYPPTSPETVEVAATSPEVAPTVAVTRSETLEKESVSEGNFDRASVGSGIDLAGGAKRSIKGAKNSSGRDWWWKQDHGAEEKGVVKDYVMEWIGTEIKKERPKSDWIGASSSSAATIGKSEKKKKKRRLDWWVSLDEEKNTKNGKKEKRRPAREWWKEEYCDELAKKKKRKKKRQMGVHNDNNGGEDWWPRDDDLYTERKKKSRSRSRSSRGSMDRWLDGFSGELWRARRNSHDSVSGDIPKSGGISSTPSMRGTVCYIAPEYGGGGDLSEKCDVYSFGVLLLVLIAGRRPLQVTSSPMSEFQRANLLSWARHLARAGKLLDLVDQSVQSIDRDQALLCITVALLCLQKSPAKRPSMKEVVAMFTGESDPPPLPFEFSPSPPSRFPFKSHKKPRGDTLATEVEAEFKLNRELHIIVMVLKMKNRGFWHGLDQCPRLNVLTQSY